MVTSPGHPRYHYHKAFKNFHKSAHDFGQFQSQSLTSTQSIKQRHLLAAAPAVAVKNSTENESNSYCSSPTSQWAHNGLIHPNFQFIIIIIMKMKFLCSINTLAQIICSRAQRRSCRTSTGRPLDSTGHPVGFCQTSTKILHICFKCLRIANFIKKCNKKFYWMSSSRISIGRPQVYTGRPVELLYMMSP